MTFEDLKQLAQNFNLVGEECRYCWSEQHSYQFKTKDKKSVVILYSTINHRVHILPFTEEFIIHDTWLHKIFLIKNLKKEIAINLIKEHLMEYKKNQCLQKLKEFESDFED